MIRIGIADDHAIIRGALRHFFSQYVDLRVTGEAASVREALELARTGQIDVLLLDLVMPGGSVLEAIRTIRQDAPRVRVLVFTSHAEEAWGVTVMQAGACGFLNKLCELEQLADAVRTVALGNTVMSPYLAQLMQDQAAHANKGLSFDQLSAQEMRVFLALARGMKLGQAADAMGISIKTASTYRSRILTKLGLKSNPDMTRYAMANRLID